MTVTGPMTAVKLMRRAAGLSFVTALSVTAMPTALAQSTRERLDALESRLTNTEQLLQGSALAELSTRIDQLEAQVRALRGELDTQANEQAALRKQLADLAGELDRRLAAAPAAAPAQPPTPPPEAPPVPAAEAASATAAVPVSAAVTTAAPSDARPATVEVPAATAASTTAASVPAASVPAAGAERDPLGPVQRYQLAFEALRAADYPKAIAGFDDMITRYPDHALATNARYWLGRSHFLQRDYARAVPAFNAALAGALEAGKAPDALLKKAQAELQLGLREDARRSLGQLIERFPDSEQARQASGLLATASAPSSAAPSP